MQMILFSSLNQRRWVLNVDPLRNACRMMFKANADKNKVLVLQGKFVVV